MAMNVIKLDVLLADEGNQKDIASRIQQGAVFVYPTDTIYGVGCDAGNPEAVQRIRDIKGTDHPFSVIAPSNEWIAKNLVVNHPEYLRKLPGPFTLIFRKKDPCFLSGASPGDSLGIRIPDHRLTWLFQKTGMPIVTTSMNQSGKPFNINPDEIMANFDIDFIVDAGPLSGTPSSVIDLTGDEPRVLRP
ncbi:MAG: L-threonylcarbamoyladenylate synthase [Candidatus Aenigmatarchaeota archaeon]